MNNLLDYEDYNNFGTCGFSYQNSSYEPFNLLNINNNYFKKKETKMSYFLLKIYISDLPEEITEESDFDDCFDTDIFKACNPRDPFVLDNKISKAVSLYEEVYNKKIIKENFDFFIQNFDKLLIEDSTELYMFLTMARIDFIRESIKFTIEYDIDDLLLSLAYRKDEKLYIKQVDFDTVENEIKKALR